eukprot:6189478-Pleurochrysis_carterae.AAC.2
MSYESLRDAAHVPPPDWDFSMPWTCRHCQVAIFRSRQEFNSDMSRLRELQSAADDTGDKAAIKMYSTEMHDHSKSHLDQLKYVVPVLEAGTDIFLVDPLHCLELNCAKTAW